MMTGRGDVILNKSILFHIVSIIGSAPLFFVDVLFKFLIFHVLCTSQIISCETRA